MAWLATRDGPLYTLYCIPYTVLPNILFVMATGRKWHSHCAQEGGEKPSGRKREREERESREERRIILYTV